MASFSVERSVSAESFEQLFSQIGTSSSSELRYGFGHFVVLELRTIAVGSVAPLSLLVTLQRQQKHTHTHLLHSASVCDRKRFNPQTQTNPTQRASGPRVAVLHATMSRALHATNLQKNPPVAFLRGAGAGVPEPCKPQAARSTQPRPTTGMQHALHLRQQVTTSWRVLLAAETRHSYVPRGPSEASTAHLPCRAETSKNSCESRVATQVVAIHRNPDASPRDARCG